MIKLLVYMDRVHTKGAETRCYVFDFATIEAATKAIGFYVSNGCKAQIVTDIKK